MLVVSIAGLAAGRFRIGLRRTFAERRSLSLAGANGLIQLPGQLSDLGREFGNLLGEFPAAGARRLVHSAMLPHQPLANCAGLGEALNKYLQRGVNRQMRNTISSVRKPSKGE